MNASELIIKAFHAILADVFAAGHRHYWMDGGRASTKSSFISICIVLLVASFPWANAVIVRRFSNTLRDSVYTQVLWAIGELGLDGYFQALKSPLEIVYLPTGQRIVFRGMDDPLKLKGVKFEKGYAAVIWFEELDQFAGWEVVQSAINSLRRGGDTFWLFYSYNPPKTLWSWVNKKRLEMERDPSAIVHHSTYLDVVEEHPDWLGEPFIEDAEWLRDTNPNAYRWELLGEITGTGGNVFDNVKEVRLTDEEIRGFEHHRNGIDWGWFPDPWRFVRCDFQADERRLVIYDERSRHKTVASDTARIVADALTYSDRPEQAPYYHDQTVWCDDTADGKQQMAVYRRELGIKARPARKGNMRRLSYQWLAGLREIAIDPVRCPLTFEEFTLKEYMRDRNDEWIDEIPDGNDHSIDAVRYAVMEDVLRGKAS